MTKLITRGARTKIATRSIKNATGRTLMRCRRTESVTRTDMIPTVMRSNVKNSPVHRNIGQNERRTTMEVVLSTHH